MFRTVKRIIGWCGKFRRKLYIGFLFSILSTWFTAMPIMLAAYVIGRFIEDKQRGVEFDSGWIGLSFVLILISILLRFLFDYFRAKYQECISYELVERDRLAIGEALKRVSLGYFQHMNTGNILNSITTGLHSLENMGMRMIDNYIGGYINFLCIFLCLLIVNPVASAIAFGGVALSLIFLGYVSRHSQKNAPVSAKAGRDLTAAAIEYARGLSVVKSFGQAGVSISTLKKACRDSKEICLEIEKGYIPYNCLHLFSLKLASVVMAGVACYLGLEGDMKLAQTLMVVFFSFHIFAGIEPISDSAHVLGVIDNAMDKIDMLKENNYIDTDGEDVCLSGYGIEFRGVSFGYDSRKVLRDVSFNIAEGSTTAIVGPSGSGKSTICNLIARFYDVNEGEIKLGGLNIRNLTCDSLLSNISMVFQNVYLFHDTVRNNICFGKPDVTEEDMIEAAKKACCHDFIMALPNGYDTVIGEGGGNLSGGEKQRISIARAILKDAPIVILDEATASIDPENEHLIQQALGQLTIGKTVVVIAHRLATIEHADQILVVDDGEIVQQGTHDELMEQEGIYRRFVAVRERTESWSIEE